MRASQGTKQFTKQEVWMNEPIWEVPHIGVAVKSNPKYQRPAYGELPSGNCLAGPCTALEVPPGL